MFYYVILEYPNLPVNQNDDKNATFNGEVTVEESDKKPDINILAFKVEQEDGSYKEQTDIPGDGYVFNQEKSTCTNGAIPKWNSDTKELITSNLTKSGTSCYLTFDTKKGQPASIIFASIKNNANSTHQISHRQLKQMKEFLKQMIQCIKQQKIQIQRLTIGEEQPQLIT